MALFDFGFRSSFWLVLSSFAFAFSASAQIATPTTDSTVSTQNKVEATVSEYQRWVGPNPKGPALGRFGDEVLPLQVVITAIEGDEPKAKTSGPQLPFTDRVSYGCEISTQGHVNYFEHSDWGTKGSYDYSPIPAADFKRLKQLLTQLPDDGSHLPPAGRRLVVRFLEADHYSVRVYDRANAPDEVFEILRFTLSGIGSKVPTFKPLSQLKVSEYTSYGAFGTSPDSQLLLTAAMRDTLKVWNPTNLALIREVPNPEAAVRICFNPKGSLVALEGGGDISVLETKSWQQIQRFDETRCNLSSPQFTPDGKFLLVQSRQSSQMALLVFDTKTWTRRETLAGIPGGAVSFFPAPGTRRCLYLTQKGSLKLWDSRKQRDIALLDEHTRIHRVAFSPDRSLVAGATEDRDSKGFPLYRLRIWNVATGQLVHELRTFERQNYGVPEGLLWSADGHYVMAATKAGGVFDNQIIAVWNAQSGRQRGAFTGIFRVNGLALLPDGRLIAGSNDGSLRIWNATQAFEEIKAWEKSLL